PGGKCHRPIGRRRSERASRPMTAALRHQHRSAATASGCLNSRVRLTGYAPSGSNRDGPMVEQPCVLYITRRGTATEPFGWEVVRRADNCEIARSSRTFATRAEALADSARVVVSLTLESPGWSSCVVFSREAAD